MASPIKVGPQDVHSGIDALRCGINLELQEGRYKDPLIIASKSGTQDRPIILSGKNATVGKGETYEHYRKTANRLSAVQEAGGQYPGVYYVADNAALILRDCQWLVIEDLVFDGCWPTAIYLDNCQHITIRGVDFRGGTFAIGATGPNTRHLLIEECSWIQDISRHGMTDLASIRAKDRIVDADPPSLLLWQKMDWEDVHRNFAETNKRVSVNHDARAFDGDFFRAWTIAGYVIIRNNVIIDAFNAIHFFNQAAASTVTNFSRNVLIENNWFVRIRDNAVEPEDFAWNWTVRHNKFVDCYGLFSLEMQRSGYFYIYGNLGWNRYRPGPPRDEHTSGQLFKFPVAHEADGPHYVFHNSWLIRAAITKKHRFRNFHHINNAIGYYEEDGERPPRNAHPFGSKWNKPDEKNADDEATAKAEEKRFTREWRKLGIEFDGDVVDHPDFPENLRNAGYPLGIYARRQPLLFHNERPGRPKGLRLSNAPVAIRLELRFPDGRQTYVRENRGVVGAWQDDGLIHVEDPAFVASWPVARVGRQKSSRHGFGRK
ncbi:right-handed parallel beta-helix repeat-containing protein [Rhizobium herbae]|uniref:Right-handed parallel beta-helix repeat-containing protein n=1 Tax=Rhizobium herbae TaxID=508661 RepID=A0ABS4EUG0_9HYPH|nr:right-handed parallel beta-helix repeat-containing protein [Rhizobium herbae]MBP1861560.1 hypothetical protein [Rhizobium herbae]